MHFILTLLAGVGILLACALGPWMLGYPIILYARRRGYWDHIQTEDSWLMGFAIMVLLSLAYLIGSIFT